MRISDWSSDVCSSDRLPKPRHYTRLSFCWVNPWCCSYSQPNVVDVPAGVLEPHSVCNLSANLSYDGLIEIKQHDVRKEASCNQALGRSEEHTSELQSLMRNSYAVFCLKTKNNKK